MNQPNLDPIQLYTKLIHQLWTYVLKLLPSCNTNQANTTDNFPSNMLTDVQGIYAARELLSNHTHNQIYNHTQEELLLKPKPYTQKWIQNNQKYIQNKLKILAKQTQIDTQDIWQFFMPH